MSIFNRFFGKKPIQSQPDVSEKIEKQESISEIREPFNSHQSSTFSKSEAENVVYDKRTIRVFISSTFRDMVEDRNALMTHCWPELRRFCRERQVELVEVDLRWGIAEEQSTRKETLKLCLDEIRACRPFFIGLLGERYGWVPDDAAFTKDLIEEQPWLLENQGKSVTELEILHGVLNNPEMAGRAFFYFRDPKYVETVPKEKKADFLSETDADANKQTELKDLIRKTCVAKKIPLLETYPDPQSLAPIVLEKLKEAIGTQFPIEDIPDPLTREARDHEAFAESRRKTYIDRPDYFDALNKHCLDIGKPKVLLGDSGCGKSSLLANWVDLWRKTHPTDFIFQHYIGGTPDGSVHWKLMIRLMAEIKRWTDDPEELPKTNDDIFRDFPLWLSKARIIAEHRGVRFVVVLDALNQLEDKDHGRLMGWLPEHPFAGSLRLIASTLPGDSMEAIEKRGWSTHKIEPLKIEERRRMIVEYLARFSKKLDEPRLKRLSSESAAANPLYLKILLDELRVTGTHDKLDERLDDYLKAKDITTLLGKVLARYQNDYERDRKGLVSEALGLIWAARRGLTETELLQLLRPDDLPQLPLAIWSLFRAALEESLIEHGGILNFAHDFLRTAVETAYLPDLDTKDDFRIQLADYFESLEPTERSCDELPWLLLQVEMFNRLQNCLINIDCFVQIFRRDEDELRGFWVYLNKESLMGEAYLDSFDKWLDNKRNDLENALLISSDIGVFLNNSGLFSEAEKVYEFCLELSKNVYSYNPIVALNLENLAGIYLETNRIHEAEPLLRKALEINEKYIKDFPEQVARSLNNLSRFLIDTKQFDEAENLMKRALKIDQNSYGENHPKVAIRLNNLGEILRNKMKYSEAEPLFLKALSIDESNFGENHITVARELNNLSLVLLGTSKLVEAEKLIRRTIKIYENCLGENHQHLAMALANLSWILNDRQEYYEAEKSMKRAIKIWINTSHNNGIRETKLQRALAKYNEILLNLGWNQEKILLYILDLNKNNWQ